MVPSQEPLVLRMPDGERGMLTPGIDTILERLSMRSARASRSLARRKTSFRSPFR